MFEAGKGLKCLANNARISVENWKKNTLNDFIRKLDKKTKFRDLDHMKDVLKTCWEQIRQDLMNKTIDQWLDKISIVICAKGRHIEHCLL